MRKLMIVALGFALASSAIAKTAGFQASLTPDIAVQDRTTEINGFSIGVWNENPSPEFQWQLGFVNGTTGESVGVQWFVFLPTLFNYAENHTGAQLGWVNYASESITGLQWGMVNITGQLTGLQLGLVNYAKTAQNGLQIGLVNIIQDNEWFSDFPNDLAKGMVLVNWSFGSK